MLGDEFRGEIRRVKKGGAKDDAIGAYRLRVGREAPSPAGAHYVEIAGEGAPAKGVVLATKSLLDEIIRRGGNLRGFAG